MEKFRFCGRFVNLTTVIWAKRITAEIALISPMVWITQSQKAEGERERERRVRKNQVGMSSLKGDVSGYGLVGVGVSDYSTASLILSTGLWCTIYNDIYPRVDTAGRTYARSYHPYLVPREGLQLWIRSQWLAQPSETGQDDAQQCDILMRESTAWGLTAAVLPRDYRVCDGPEVMNDNHWG